MAVWRRCDLVDEGWQGKGGVMESGKIEVFYDGDCPLCRREIRMLRRLDRHGRIEFTDIAAPGFDAPSIGLDQATLMGKMHARLPSGEIIAGVEVFRRLYTAVGFGPLVAISRAPGIAQALDLGYRWFAKNRLRLTGRCRKDGDGVAEPK